MKKRNLRLFFAVCFLFLFLGIDSAFALRLPDIQYPSIPFSDVKTPNEFIQDINSGAVPATDAFVLYIKYFYTLSIIIAVLAVFCSIVYGGLQYLIARSQSGAAILTLARDRISSGILGLLILFLAQIILTTINPDFAVFSFTAPDTERCDCSKPKDQLSDYCKIFCQRTPMPPENEAPTYVEVPLGRMAEWVLKKSMEAETVASTTTKIAQVLKAKVERLDSLTQACSCSGSGTRTECSAGGCSGGTCVGEPCPGRPEIDRLQNQEIPRLIKDLQEWRWNTFLAKEALKREYVNLVLAEDILRDSISEPLNFQSYIGIDKRTTEKITHWANIDISYNPLTNLTESEDPSTFYIVKKGNEELIELVQNVAAPPPNPSPPPITCLEGESRPYSICDGTACVVIDSCGANDCNDCGNQPPACPSGETRPHSVCDGNTCISVDSCGPNKCENSGSCIAPPPNCPTGNSPCNPNNLLNPFSGEYMRASAVCQGESGSNPNALANTCGNSNVMYQEYSVGLFQMNLAVGRCNGGVEYTNPECGQRNGYCTTCEIKNREILQECENHYGRGADPSVYSRNIDRAYELFRYSGWCPWTVGKNCGFCR